MGLESANYVFNSHARVEISQLAVVVKNLGGHENPLKRPNHGTEFIINGENHWIDLQWLDQSQTGRPAVFIRVALCNPLDVGAFLKNLLDAMFDLGEAVLFDTRSKLEWRSWNNRNWEELWDSYLHQRSDFRKAFGNYEAAISAGKVFENLRKLPGSEPQADDV
jgi:hypothetical protein